MLQKKQQKKNQKQTKKIGLINAGHHKLGKGVKYIHMYVYTYICTFVSLYVDYIS